MRAEGVTVLVCSNPGHHATTHHLRQPPVRRPPPRPVHQAGVSFRPAADQDPPHLTLAEPHEPPTPPADPAQLALAFAKPPA